MPNTIQEIPENQDASGPDCLNRGFSPTGLRNRTYGRSQCRDLQRRSAWPFRIRGKV